MDGDGRNMVAIVQSLRDAGLVVTVVDSKRGSNSATAFLAINTNSGRHERRSLGVNTKLKSAQHSSTQSNDARYASMYQLSHCGLKPTSPPVHLPEFPPQRAAPHFTEGNFVVRGWRSSECQYTPVRSTHSCRRNMRWFDRGSVHRWAQDTTAFAHSLRKYPNLSPNKSLSTELVQRLLNYTQNKQLSKSSCNTQNVGDTKTLPEKKSECVEKSSKNVQTKKMPDRNGAANNKNNEIKYTKQNSYAPDKSRHSIKDKHQNCTYDYLKKTKPRGWNNRSTEVRYLTDVTKCIKDAIRNICDDTPLVCPRVQSRYSQHRRLHHSQIDGQPTTSTNDRGSGTGSKPCGLARCPSPENVYPRIRNRYSQHKEHRHAEHKSRSSCNSTEVQACPPGSAREACVMTRCESPTSLIHRRPNIVRRCCICKKPLPCHCKSEMERKIEKEVLDWIKEIPVYSDDTADNKCLRNMLSIRLIDKLQKILKNGDFKNAKDEIIKCLNVLPMWCPENENDKIVFKDQLAEILISKLKDHLEPVDKKEIEKETEEGKETEMEMKMEKEMAMKMEKEKEKVREQGKENEKEILKEKEKGKEMDSEIRKLICEWVDESPELAGNGFMSKDNVSLIDDLCQTLTEQQKHAGNEELKALMKHSIEEWIEKALKSKNVILDSNTKSTLAQKLIDKIYLCKYSGENKYVQSIFDWLSDIPELSQFLNERSQVENLSKKLQELQSQGYDDEDLCDAIEDWINNLCKKYGLDIDHKTIRQFAEKLMDKLNLWNRKPFELPENFHETIAEEVFNILETEAIPLNDKVKKNLQKKLTKILSNNIENVLLNDTTEAKKDIIKLLQHESNMTPTEAKNLATTLIETAKSISKIKKPKPMDKSIPYQSKKDFKHDVKDESAGTAPEKVRVKKEKQDKTISDEIIRGTRPGTMGDEYYPFYEDTSTPNEIFDNVERKREMSLPIHDISSLENQEENLNQKPLNITDDVFIRTPKSPKSILTAAKEDTSRPSQSYDREYMQQEQKRSGYATSTPRKDHSFQPRRLTFDSSIPEVHFNDESKQSKLLPPEEQKYTDDITQTVKKWLDKMSISLNDDESRELKNVVINDLVGNIIDRQKYLQSNPGAITSEAEELENLKHQVYRWLSKVMHPDDIEIAMPQIDALINAVSTIPVPQLAVPSGTRKDDRRAGGSIPNHFDALQDEISLWVDKIPKHLQQPIDKNDHNRMINELAIKLQNVDNNNMENEIKKWVQKYFKYTNDEDIDKVAKDLKNKLTKKGFSKDASFMIEQDSGEFIEENLQGGILDWLKESPYYKSATTQDRIIQEKVVTGMAKGLRNVFETALTAPNDVDVNELFIDEIIKHLKKLPMGNNYKSNDELLRKTAENILQYLKSLELFQNISDRQSALPHDNLNNSINEWMKSLPIVGELKNDQLQIFTEQFKEKLNNISNVDDLKDVKEEIKKQLKLLPLDPVKRNDDKFLNDQVDQVIEMITKSQPKKQSGLQNEDTLFDIDSYGTNQSSKVGTDVLHENVNKFCESLPIQKGKISKEKEEAIKHNIAGKVMNIIGDLNMNPEILKDDFLYKHILEDEIDNLLSVLPLDETSKDSVNKLKSDLIDKIGESKESAKNLMAGHIYKQQLRDTISKTIQPSEELSADEEDSFTLMKEKVADAFVNLHFYGANKELKDKYKNKINREISNFCNEYLQRHPSTPLDSKKLNDELNTALNNVTFSSENAVRDEVEETRIRDLIADHTNELPLRQDTAAEKLQAYKITSLMSKRIHKLEKDKDLIDNYESALKDEIVKWTKKLPLKHVREQDINKFADNIVDALKRSEDSRKFDSTTMDSKDYNLTRDAILPTPAERSQNLRSKVGDDTSRIPPSSLTQQDRDHLQRIRDRSAAGQRQKTSPTLKDAAISPVPIDAGSQTELKPWEDKSRVPKSSSIQAATQVEPHICQSPTCGLRTARPYLESERTCGRELPEPSVEEHRDARRGQTERYIPYQLFDPVSGTPLMKSPSCECQPKFIPYQFSPGRSRSPPQSCSPPLCPVSNRSRLPQWDLAEDAFPTPKRPKRRDQSPPRHEDKPRKTIRSRVTRLGCLDSFEGTSKPPEPDKHEYNLRYNEISMPSGYSRRELLISDDEFEDHAHIDKVNCGCKEKSPLSQPISQPKQRNPCKDECIKRCPKCCGIHCPHPTYRFFKN